MKKKVGIIGAGEPIMSTVFKSFKERGISIVNVEDPIPKDEKYLDFIKQPIVDDIKYYEKPKSKFHR